MAGFLETVQGWFGRRAEPTPEPVPSKAPSAPKAKPPEPVKAKPAAPRDPNKPKKPNKGKKGRPEPVIEKVVVAAPPVVEVAAPAPVVEEAPPPLPPPPPVERKAAPRKPRAERVERPPSREKVDQDTLAWVLLPKVEALLKGADEAVAAEPADRAALVAMRSRLVLEWRALGRLPDPSLGRGYDERLAALTARIGSLPDPRVLEEEQNREARLALVVAAEALGAEADGRAAVEKAKALQRAWREAPRVSKAALAEDGARFKAALDAVFARRDTERDERVAKLRALCEQADVLGRSADPERAAEVMKQLQTRWKAVGGVRGQEGDALWTWFRAAADLVFERRRTAAASSEQANEQARQALIDQAEAMAAEGVNDPDEVIRQLQGKWRRIGPVARERSDVLWSAFKKACDRLRTPPPVDPEALGEAGDLRFNPFAALATERPPEE